MLDFSCPSVRHQALNTDPGPWARSLGQESWVQKLKWPQLSKFNPLKWKALYTDPKSSETAAFVKSYENLAFYWILKAGHMVSDLPTIVDLSMMLCGKPQCHVHVHCLDWLS